jgi:nitrate reductase alpha subunit
VHSASTCQPTNRALTSKPSEIWTTLRVDHRSLVLNYLTPHGKWHIHSTYGDNLRMETLSRGHRAVLDE